MQTYTYQQMMSFWCSMIHVCLSFCNQSWDWPVATALDRTTDSTGRIFNPFPHSSCGSEFRDHHTHCFSVGYRSNQGTRVVRRERNATCSDHQVTETGYSNIQGDNWTIDEGPFRIGLGLSELTDLWWSCACSYLARKPARQVQCGCQGSEWPG